MPFALPRPRWTPPTPSLSAVTRIGDEPGALSGPALRSLERAFQGLYASRAYPGIQLAVRHRGELVFNRSIGHAQGNGPGDAPEVPKRVLSPDTPVCLFSASKAITAVLVHWAAQEGLLDLDRPVAHYLPAFAAHGKGRVTISDLLAHRGGIPWLRFPPELKRVETLLDWQQCIDLLCAARPAALGQQAYHALSGGFILGELVQQVTGKPLTTVLDEVLRQPLGMHYFTYGLPAAQRTEVAHNYVAGDPVVFPVSALLEKALVLPVDQVVEASNAEAFMQAVIPAGNAYATAEELGRFYQMLLDGGRYDDRQVLKPATVQRLVRPVDRLRLDRTLMIPMRYSEGLMLGGHSWSLFGIRNPRAFGHIGFMNIYGWADPQREIAVGLTVTGKAVVGRHLAPLLRLLTTAGGVARARR